MTAAVEIYNKPAFAYREESFSILAINAWELLLKGKLLKDNASKLKVLWVYETRKSAAGGNTKKQYLRKNRTGNPLSISLQACVNELRKNSSVLPKEVPYNVAALMDIRDNAVHFVSAGTELAVQTQELAAATVKNFVLLARKWFARDLTKSLNLVLPLAFIADLGKADAVVVSAGESNLIKQLKTLAATPMDRHSEFSVAIKLAVKIDKSNLDGASKIKYSKDDDAVKVNLTEDDFRVKYPWDYNELIARLKSRYADFKLNPKFLNIRKPLLGDERFHNRRLLDPSNPKSSKKDYYSANVLNEFDRHYVRALPPHP